MVYGNRHAIGHLAFACNPDTSSAVLLLRGLGEGHVGIWIHTALFDISSCFLEEKILDKKDVRRAM